MVAGEKIYQKVRDVEGVLLMKVRKRAGDTEWADLMWPGAAFALEATDDEYIGTFLGYEHSSSPTGKPVTADYRGYITYEYRPDNPSNLPGYKFVDVIGSDGHRYRYTGSEQIIGRKDVRAPGVQAALRKNPQYDLNVYGYKLSSELTSKPRPRYAVTFEDHVVPEERSLGVASSTVKVVDLQTGQVLGELVRYAWSPSGPSSANPSPWLAAWKCPGQPVGASAATRKFVDQVLIPLGR